MIIKFEGYKATINASNCLLPAVIDILWTCCGNSMVGHMIRGYYANLLEKSFDFWLTSSIQFSIIITSVLYNYPAARKSGCIQKHQC